MGQSTGKLRVWFLRNLLEAAERELGAAAVATLPLRAPARLATHLTLERLRATAALDTIPLDEGEEAILAFEQALGDGSGRTLERVACEMLARQLAQAASAVQIGDLYGTVARLRAPLEHPFVDAPLAFELSRTAAGLSLAVGVAGRPRATRVLGHLAAGAVHAAERFARESHVDPLRVEVTAFADRARVEARFRRASTLPPAPEPSPLSRRSSGTSRLMPSLSDEVARILDSSRSAPRSPSEDPGAPISERPGSPDSGGGLGPARAGGAPLPAASQRRSSRPPPAR